MYIYIYKGIYIYIYMRVYAYIYIYIWLVFKSQVPKFGRGKHPRGGPPSLQNKKSPLMKQLSHKDDTAAFLNADHI